MNRKKEFFLLRWIRRFLWPGKELSGSSKQANVFDVEKIETPFVQIVKAFIDNKVAVCALFFVIAMYLFVFIAPNFMPNYYDSYEEVTMHNIPPTKSLMKVPKELRNDIKDIDSYGQFSVGLSNSGKVYVWGATELGTTGIDIADIPEEVQNDTIAMVAAGIDHIVAISEAGKVYCWGYSKLGQYGYFDEEANPNIISEPDELINGTIDVSEIKRLECGYQCSAILMNDGHVYLWGNKNTCANISLVAAQNGKIDDIDFTLNYVAAVINDGTAIYSGQRGLYSTLRSTYSGETQSVSSFLNGRKIVKIEGTSSAFAFLLDDGSVCFAGELSNANAVDVPTLQPGERFVSLDGGMYHYTGVTNYGNYFSWGSGTLGQCDVKTCKEPVDRIIVGAFQNYALDSEGKLLTSWGLKGFVFGTTNKGANVFQRVVNGGKMTLTIGFVATIIEIIIGIIIGCIAGYFGGKVDMILMRFAEVVSAIPFLPFAMILSAILAQSSLSENARIFMIMVILGVLSWPGLAFTTRAQVLVARESEYVTSAKAIGVRETRIAFKHILPNIISVILVSIVLGCASALLTESSLSYLGFGVNYPRPTWGNMLNGANNSTIIKNFWWQWFFPSLFLGTTTISINIVGDTIRDVMDPKSSAEK